MPRVQHENIFFEQGFARPDEVLKRAGPLESRVNEIYQKIGGKTPLSLGVFTDLDASPTASSRSITVPFLFLIQAREIPKHLCILGPLDPKLNSESFLLEVAHWIQGVCYAEKSTALNLMEKEAIRIFLCYVKDPLLSEKAKDFVLTHEVGHIFHKHHLAKRQVLEDQIMHLAFFAIAALALSFCVITTISFTAVILPIALSAAFSIWAIMKLSRVYFSHKIEKEADKFAIQMHPNAAEGGYYLFKTIKNYGKKRWGVSLAHKFLYSPSGELLTNLLTHPTMASRKRFCKRSITKTL